MLLLPHHHTTIVEIAPNFVAGHLYLTILVVVATALNFFAVRQMKTKNFIQVGMEMTGILVVLAGASAAIVALVGITTPASFFWGGIASNNFLWHAIFNLVSLGIVMSVEVLAATMAVFALSPFSARFHKLAWGPAN